MKKKVQKKSLEFFPKDNILFEDLVNLRFITVNKTKKSIIARYQVIPISKNQRIQHFVHEITPHLSKTIEVIPGIKTALVRPIGKKKLEFTVAMPFSKAALFFKSAGQIPIINKAVLSEHHIRAFLRLSLAKLKVQL